MYLPYRGSFKLRHRLIVQVRHSVGGEQLSICCEKLCAKLRKMKMAQFTYIDFHANQFKKNVFNNTVFDDFDEPTHHTNYSFSSNRPNTPKRNPALHSKSALVSVTLKHQVSDFCQLMLENQFISRLVCQFAELLKAPRVSNI